VWSVSGRPRLDLRDWKGTIFGRSLAAGAGWVTYDR
jgi:hypothetical protein